MTTGSNGNYVQVNGINLYYEKYGEGAPLILLHGALGSTGTFGEVLTALAPNHQVIEVDLHGHGRTNLADRPMSLEAMSDDIAGLITHLGLDKVDVMGYSMGGMTGLQLAIRHPEVVSKLVVVSAAHKLDGWYPEVQAGMASMSAAAAEPMKQTPMYQNYSQFAPRPEEWPELLDKMGVMLGRDYNWSNEVAALKMPVLMAVGDSDAVRPSCAVEFYELLGGGQRDAGWDGSGMVASRLAILPGLTHYNITSSPILAMVANNFFTAP